MKNNHKFYHFQTKISYTYKKTYNKTCTSVKNELNLRVLGLLSTGGDGIKAHVAIEASCCTGQSSTDSVRKEPSLAIANEKNLENFRMRFYGSNSCTLLNLTETQNNALIAHGHKCIHGTNAPNFMIWFCNEKIYLPDKNTPK